MRKSKRKYIILFSGALFGALDVSINASRYAAEIGSFGVALGFGLLVGCVLLSAYELYLGWSGVEVRDVFDNS